MKSSASSPEHSQPYAQTLRSLMQQSGIASFKALSRAADVSEWQVEQLRRGKAAQMRVETLHRLSQALHTSLPDLLRLFANLPIGAASAPTPLATAGSELAPPPLAADPEKEQLKQEYQRLQTQLEQQRQVLIQEFQQHCLHLLESWLIQFPTAAHAAQHNPQIPAARLLPLMRPIEQLLAAWGVEAIAPVGAEVAYDPHLHQVIEGTAQPGAIVRVRYTGYRQGERLLYRAKVSLAGGEGGKS